MADSKDVSVEELPSCVHAQSEAELELAEFLRIKKNSTCVLAMLVKLAQRIEICWDKDENLRLWLLHTYRSCLMQLQSASDPNLVELSRLGFKMRKSIRFSLRHFLAMSLPVERKHTKGLKDCDFLVDQQDRSRTAGPSIPLVVVLDNLRAAFNVGAVFRTAECLGVSKVFVCGFTASPSDPHMQKAAMGTDTLVAWEYYQSTSDCVTALKASGVPVVALETVQGSRSIYDFQFPHPSALLPANPPEHEPSNGARTSVSRYCCALVIGNERHGVSETILPLCDAIVNIPCRGIKNSLNVGVAFGIAGYEIARQWVA